MGQLVKDFNGKRDERGSEKLNMLTKTLATLKARTLKKRTGYVTEGHEGIPRRRQNRRSRTEGERHPGKK